MNMELFIKQMNGEHKDAVIEKHIVRQYVPFEEKIAEAKRIVELSCYKTITAPDGTEQRVFSVNSVYKEFYTFLTLIKLYTDIDISENIVADYNALAEKKISKKLIGAMPEDARDFNTILNMTFEDEIENATSVGNVINRIFNSADSALGVVINEMIARGMDNGEEKQG